MRVSPMQKILWNPWLILTKFFVYIYLDPSSRLDNSIHNSCYFSRVSCIHIKNDENLLLTHFVSHLCSFVVNYVNFLWEGIVFSFIKRNLHGKVNFIHPIWACIVFSLHLLRTLILDALSVEFVLWWFHADNTIVPISRHNNTETPYIYKWVL